MDAEISAPASHQFEEVDHHFGAPDASDDNHSALVGERSEDAWQAGRANQFEDDIEWSALGGRGRVDHLERSELTQAPVVGGVAGRGHDPGPGRRRQLHTGCAHSSGGARHQHVFSPSVRPAWLHSVSYAVENASGNPPA